MNRIRLRKKYIFRHKFSAIEKIIIILIILITSLFFSFKYISNTITPTLMNYAEVEARKFINIIINKAVSESKIADVNSLVSIDKSNGEINTVDFNVSEVNNVLTTISENIEENIKNLEDGNLTGIPGYEDSDLKKGIIYKIPSGLIFKDNLLSNIGPRIPVKIYMRGSILSNIDTNLTNYGINNALVKISIKLTLEEQVLLPFTLKTIEVETSIPVIVKMIEGTVPKYYGGSINESSPIVSLPLEEN